MKESRETKLLRKAYRNFLNEEIRRPEVRQEKKEFIANYFGSEPVFFLRPAFIVPAAGFMAVLLVFIYFQRPMKQIEQPKVISRVEEKLAAPARGIHEMPKEIAPIKPEPMIPVPKAVPQTPMVEVKRAVSRVGTPMVYQKSNHGHPITVIWVFTGGNGL